LLYSVQANLRAKEKGARREEDRREHLVIVPPALVEWHSEDRSPKLHMILYPQAGFESCKVSS